MNRPLQRMTIALVTSMVLNCILIAMPFFTNPETFPSSVFGKIVHVLGRPGGTFTEWLLPGHDMSQVVLVIVSSVVFYAVLAWLVLSFVFWRGRRTTDRPAGQ